MKTFLLSLLLFIGGIANATTFYISPSGNDATGNGSAASPWKTLYKATSTVNTPGDIIHVNAGTYTETQTCNLAVGVSIEGDGVTSVIRSTVSADWIPLLRAASNAEGTNGNQHISNVKFDGQNLTTFWGIEIVGRKNFSIYNCTIVDFDDRGVIFAGRVDNGNAPPTTYATGNSFHDNIMTNCARYTPGYGAGCLNIGGQRGMLVYNNTISQDSRSLGNNGWPIKYWNDGYLDDCKIYNNTLNKIMSHSSLGDGCWDFAIELFNVRGLEISNNIMNGGGIDLNYQDKGTYPFSVWIHHNTIQMPYVNTHIQTAVTLEFQSETVIIEDNIFDKVNIGVNYTPRNGSVITNNTIRRNLMSNIGRGDGTGFFITFGGGGNLTFNNLDIYNNTMTCVTGGNAPFWGIDLPNVSSGSITNVNIKNNIIQGTISGGITQYSNVGINTLNISYNDMYLNGNNNAPVFTNAPAPTNYTYANNKLGVNPLFVGGNNYTLQATSPCIDGGTNVGFPYNGSAPDIGYAEYGGASSGPTPPVVGTITQPTCAVATGSVVLNGLPATGTWTLTRSPGAVTSTGTGTTTTITGLAAGTYTYTVTDATGTSTPSANIVINTQPATPSAPTVGTITQPTCAVATGSVALSGLPATGTWTLTRTPGGTTTTGTGTTTTVTGLAAGTYTYTVTNASGCISVASANVVINAQPTPASAPTVGTITQPTCAVATGSVVLNGLPATGTWTLTRSPGAVTTTGTGTTTTITGLAAGTYSYTVTNASGCTSAASANVVINAQPATPSAPTVGIITQPTCAVATGSVVLNGLPATGTWTLTRSPGAVTSTGTGTTTTITGLAAGTYTYTVTNASGCISVASANVVINAQPATASAPTVGTITQPTCTVATGSVVLNGLPATGTWTLTRTPGGVTTTGTGTTTTITGLAAGTYTYTVTNASGCTSAASANVVINAQPATASVPTVGTITQPTCAVATGSVALSGLPATGTWTLTRTPGGVTTTGTGTTTTITGLAAGTYTYTVTNASGCTSAASANVVINAQPVTPSAPIVGTITQPAGTVTTGSVDLSGLPATGTWTLLRTPGAVIITGTGTTITIAGLAPGTYTYTVTNASGCTSTPSANVVINGGAPNIPPVADAGPDQSITLPTNAIILSGSGTDADGIIVAYTWTKVSGPAAGTITNPTTAATAVTGLTQGVYQFELRVTDNSGAFDRDTMQVTVNPVASNIPPTANAGSNQTITLPTNSIILSGSGTDSDGTVVAYLWTKVSGPAAGTITNPATAATSVTGLTQGVYQFELRVTDNNGAFGRDTMQVTVNPAASNIPPIANAGPNQTITLPTNSIILSGSGTDPDGTVVAYLWTKVSGPAAGTITNPATAATSVTGLAQGVYQFELRVTDNNGAFGRDTVQVTVNPGAPNNPPTANAGPDQTITLPTNSVILSGSGADSDGTIVAYLWTKVSGPAAGNITSPNAAGSSVTGLAQGTYKFELRVTDNSGAFGRDTMQVTVNPGASNIPPTANAGPDQTITLPTDFIILSGSGTDPDGTVVAYLWTKVSGPAAGTITNPSVAATAVTGLVQGTYKFELRVTDNTGAFGRDTMQVIVNPIGTNIPPVANAGPNQTITLPTDFIILSGSGTDPDGIVVGYVWTKVSGPAAGNITNPNMAATSVTGLAQGVYQFELRVIDNNGAFGRDTMQVTVNPIGTNIPPDADAGPDQTITLPTNFIILSGSGNDPDGIIVDYLWTKVSGPVAGTITNPDVAATAVIGLVPGVYLFELRVTDDRGAFGRDTIQVTVNDAPNVAPTANAGADQSIVAPATSTASSVNVTGSGTDPDGIIVAYLWTKVSGPAAGSVANPTSAASSVTGLVVGTYQFELRVTDDDGAFGRDTMQVTISAPPNTLPVANAGPDRAITLPTNSTSLTGSGTDADGTIVTYTWRQVSGPSINVLFSLNTAVTYLNNLVEGTYEFELTVTDNRGGQAKDNVLVIVSGTTIVVNSLQINDASLYPNPVVGITTLDIKSEKQNAKLSILISDIQGKIVYRKDVTATQFRLLEKIDMSNLGKGTYVVTVYFENGEKQSIKAIKQ